MRRAVMAATAAMFTVGALLTSWIIVSSEQNPSDAAVTSTQDRDGYAGTLLNPPISRPALQLFDTEGRPFDLRTRPADEVTVLFFGYTNCDDVCPTTMADLAAARRALPSADRPRVTIVFVTEDPARDTPVVLRRWLNQFDPAILGLIGGNDITTQVLSQLYLPASSRYEMTKPTAHAYSGDEPAHQDANGDDYEVEHSGAVYAFGPKERAVLYTGGTTVPEYSADFARLLRG
jgi:protein SCO1/2